MTPELDFENTFPLWRMHFHLKNGNGACVCHEVRRCYLEGLKSLDPIKSMFE